MKGAFEIRVRCVDDRAGRGGRWFDYAATAEAVKPSGEIVATVSQRGRTRKGAISKAVSRLLAGEGDPRLKAGGAK